MFGNICPLKTQANHISYFYILNNLALTDIETMKTPTHLKNHRLASKNTVFFFPAFNISLSSRAANTSHN